MPSPRGKRKSLLLASPAQRCETAAVSPKIGSPTPAIQDVVCCAYPFQEQSAASERIPKGHTSAALKCFLALSPIDLQLAATQGHALSRPAVLEGEATARAIRLAK